MHRILYHVQPGRTNVAGVGRVDLAPGWNLDPCGYQDKFQLVTERESFKLGQYELNLTCY